MFVYFLARWKLYEGYGVVGGNWFEEMWGVGDGGGEGGWESGGVWMRDSFCCFVWIFVYRMGGRREYEFIFVDFFFLLNKW